MKMKPYLLVHLVQITRRLCSRSRLTQASLSSRRDKAMYMFACASCLAVILLAMPALSTAAPGKPATAGSDSDMAGAMAVRELMRLDTELALSASRSQLAGTDKRTETALALSDRPGGQLKLVAIYGVGKRLLAEVLVGSQPYVYLRGQPLPIGAKPSGSVYKLAGISGSCVQLERQDEAHTLCLHPSLQAAR